MHAILDGLVGTVQQVQLQAAAQLELQQREQAGQRRLRDEQPSSPVSAGTAPEAAASSGSHASARSAASGSDEAAEAQEREELHLQQWLQQERRQQQEREGGVSPFALDQDPPAAGEPASGSPPERLPQHSRVAAAVGASGFGFGSPIKLSAQMSPAKPPPPSGLGKPAAAGAPGVRAAAAASWAPQQQQQQQAAKTLSFGLQPVAAQARGGQATPALRRPDGALDPYCTARSMASASHSSAGAAPGSSSRLATAVGGGKTAGAATPLVSMSGGGSGRKDLDSIVGSIRRMAAEMR